MFEEFVIEAADYITRALTRTLADGTPAWIVIFAAVGFTQLIRSIPSVLYRVVQIIIIVPVLIYLVYEKLTVRKFLKEKRI